MVRRWPAGLALIGALFLAVILAPHVAAQDTQPAERVEVVIEWPNEGETLYAAPSTLQYSIPLKGRIAGLGADSDEVTVELIVLQDGEVIGSYIQVTVDRAYSFLATVNPHNSEEIFPAEHLACADDCHRPGTFALPVGAVTARVTIIEPEEMTPATAERNFVVDHSAMATIPVELWLDGDPEQPVTGVTVSGATWLYLWRSRQFLASSDAAGTARLPVEALGNAPTEYLLRVVPTVVDGVLYEGLDEARVVLSPGATSGPTVTLHVHAHLGRIEGQVRNFDPATPCHARAISLPDGNTFTTEVTSTGSFVFEDLPIDQYRVVLESEELIALQQESVWEDVNLTAAIDESVSLPLAATPGQVFHGRIAAENGATLPFGWVGAGDRSSAVTPADGQFAVKADREEVTLLVQVPGFYSEARAVDAQTIEMDFVVKPSKETQVVPWGDGELWLPADNKAELDGQQISLVNGWVWGAGESDSPFRITTDAAVINVATGRFALEYLPGDRGWLYVFDGQAELQDRHTGAILTVYAGEMVNLFNRDGLQVAPYDPLVLKTLNGWNAAPMTPQWEPSLSALIRNRAGLLSIGLAQLITFVTYFLVLLSLGVTPLILLYLQYRRRRVNVAGADAKTQP